MPHSVFLLRGINDCVYIPPSRWPVMKMGETNKRDSIARGWGCHAVQRPFKPGKAMGIGRDQGRLGADGLDGDGMGRGLCASADA